MKPLSRENVKEALADAGPLFLLWAIFFIGRPSEAQLKMDAMTYAALAKHIVATGDWWTLHYTPSAYANFYQHPPLILWMQAVVFSWFGASNATARLLPALFAAGTIAGVYIWAKRETDRFGGFAAALVLLFSFPYLKYGSDFLLDGPLAFFLVSGSLAFLEIDAGPRRGIGRCAFAVSIAAALLTKGLVGFSLPLSVGIYALLSNNRRRLVAEAAIGCVGAIALLSPWWFLAGGSHYTAEYLRQSVSGRTSAAQFSNHFLPLGQLVQTYPLGLILLLIASAMRVREKKLRFFEGAIGLAWLHALIIVGAFCYIGHFLEHYLVPFFPMAAVALAPLVARVPERARSGAKKLAWGLGTIGVVLMLLWPYRIVPRRQDPIRIAARWLVDKCPDTSDTETLITASLSEQWLALATILWETDSTATSITKISEPQGKQILITAPNEVVPTSWARLDDNDASPFRAYRSDSACRGK